jgi:hypothetical protein
MSVSAGTTEQLLDIGPTKWSAKHADKGVPARVLVHAWSPPADDCDGSVCYDVLSGENIRGPQRMRWNEFFEHFRRARP